MLFSYWKASYFIRCTSLLLALEHTHPTMLVLKYEKLIDTLHLIYRLVFGLLYPAYCSYKAIKKRSASLYLKWMMYWIVFALFYNVETITDIFISWLVLLYIALYICNLDYWMLSAIQYKSVMNYDYLNNLLT